MSEKWKTSIELLDNDGVSMFKVECREEDLMYAVSFVLQVASKQTEDSFTRLILNHVEKWMESDEGYESIRDACPEDVEFEKWEPSDPWHQILQKLWDLGIEWQVFQEGENQPEA